MSTSHEKPVGGEGLRERHGQVNAKDAANIADVDDFGAEELEKEKKTFGRTPDGTSKYPRLVPKPGIS